MHCLFSKALQHPILSNRLDVGKLQTRRPSSVHPVIAVPEAVLGRATGQSRERAPSLIAAASTSVQLEPTLHVGQHLEQAQLQSLQPVQPDHHQKLVTLFQPGREYEMSGEEGKASEEEREGKMVEETVPQMLENGESERMNSSQMRSSDLSSSKKQGVEKSELGESVKEVTIFSEDPMENVVVAVNNQTDESVERSSFNLKAEEMRKPADSTKVNTTMSSPKKDILEEKLASLQRRLDATLKQLAASKTVEPRASLRGGQLFEGGKGGLVRLDPRKLLRGRTLIEEELEPRRLVRERTNVLTDGEEGSTSQEGRVAMMFTQTDSVQEEPIRYFYLI